MSLHFHVASHPEVSAIMVRFFLNNTPYGGSIHHDGPLMGDTGHPLGVVLMMVSSLRGHC